MLICLWYYIWDSLVCNRWHRVVYNAYTLRFGPLWLQGIPPHHELLSVSNHMTEGRFKCITLAIVTVSLTIGLLIPNIELVLGLVGSTIGVLICVIIPATLFLCLTTKNNNERLLAQVFAHLSRNGFNQIFFTQTNQHLPTSNREHHS